jgi:hypothetical protein
MGKPRRTGEGGKVAGTLPALRTGTPIPTITYCESVIFVFFAVGVVAGAVVSAFVVWLRWHAIVAVVGALLSAVVLTALLAHEVKKVDGIPLTQREMIGLGIVFASGGLVPVMLLGFWRWVNRQPEIPLSPDPVGRPFQVREPGLGGDE